MKSELTISTGPHLVSDFHKERIKDASINDVVINQSFPLEMYQWISGIKYASSTYANGWETETMIGPPKVFPQYGDIRGAWAPRTSRGTMESLQLIFSTPVYPTGVDIFETYNPGHIISVSFLHPTPDSNKENWEQVWSQQVDLKALPPQSSRVFSPPLKEKVLMFKTNILKLDLDCTHARSWCEIDCVALRGLLFVEWSPEKHREFPVLFKDMVKTFLLINQRREGTCFWLPKVMVYKIFNHCALSWPSDEEIQQEKERREIEERFKKEREEKQRLELERKVSGKIEILEELFRDGVITEDVLNAKKKSLLEQMKNEGSIQEEEF